MLTENLSKIIHQMETLNDIEQNQIANLLQEELNWSISFRNSQSLLSSMAREALEEHDKNQTKTINCK